MDDKEEMVEMEMRVYNEFPPYGGWNPGVRTSDVQRELGERRATVPLHLNEPAE